MKQTVQELIKERKSVRTFDKQEVKSSDKEKLETFLQSLENPFNIPVSFSVLEGKIHGISSPVVVGTDLYLAAKVKRVENYECALGYSFESACLYAQSLGLGSVILAASLSRNAFEKAMGVQSDEVMPVATPLGYPAKKRAIRDSLMRKGLKSDTRFDFNTLFYKNDFDTPLTRKQAGLFKEALEMLRWAPSATNKQPWRAVVQDNAVHFLIKKSLPESALGDIQKVDIGIGLSHFDLTLQEQGIHGLFFKQNPDIKTNEDLEYVISYQVKL